MSFSKSSEDSTVLYSAPIWQIRQLVAIAQRAKVCDTLVRYQEEVIRLSIRVEASTDSLLTLSRKEANAVKILASLWEEKYNTQVSITTIIKKQKRKWVTIAIVAIVVAVVEFVKIIGG